MRRGLVIAGLAALFLAGCGDVIQPFEPVKLETIGSNEEGFLIPWTGDTTRQTSTNNEEFLRRNLVSGKQIRVPQQWVPKGRQWVFYNGEWRDAAQLIKVDLSPVTRKWTAEANRGTSNQDEAIWVMTADQVEFSTGWTCTARIATRDDAVKFLHNYPNGALSAVMDHEIHAMLQATFSIEVTDLPMEKLRNDATPHILATVKKVTDFFKDRGITITNLGITGGFVYKNATIGEKMAEVYKAEQEKSIAIAKTQAQEELNKQIQFAAEAKARAALTERQAEAEGINLVTAARQKELEAAKADLATYVKLKEIEVQKVQADRWNGTLPQTVFGGQVIPLLNVGAK